MQVFVVTGGVACIGEFSFLEEITAIWLKEWVNKPFTELEKELTSRSITMQRSYFQQKTLSTERLNQIHQLNAEGLLKKWDCTHLQDGCLGFNYNYTEGEAVLSARDVMRMWGLSKFLIWSRTCTAATAGCGISIQTTV